MVMLEGIKDGEIKPTRVEDLSLPDWLCIDMTVQTKLYSTFPGREISK